MMSWAMLDHDGMHWHGQDAICNTTYERRPHSDATAQVHHANKSADDDGGRR
jgi:hypothetical protein